jgi:hypothetical protein
MRFPNRLLACFITTAFIFNLSITPVFAAQPVLNLPAPGTMVELSQPHVPLMIKGVSIHPDNPLMFDFIVDTGHSGLQGSALKDESEKLIKYFLASLTIPENDFWVNLSPYEKERITSDGLGQTDMGRDLLAQDYLLKQLTASLIYPEKELGKNFWDRVYKQANDRYGSAQVPVNTFNKVWVMGDKASVFQRNNTAFVVENRLKVMLEEDYLALQKNVAPKTPQSSDISSKIIREIILPEIEREVNTGKNFAALRQIFNSLILANWYKDNLKQALLNQVYSGKNMTGGIKAADTTVKEKIYQQYLAAYKKGVFNYIKEDIDRSNKQPMPRKYFSGGVLQGERVRHPAAASEAMFVANKTAIAAGQFHKVSAFTSKVSGSRLDAAQLVSRAKDFLSTKMNSVPDFILDYGKNRGISDNPNDWIQYEETGKAVKISPEMLLLAQNSPDIADAVTAQIIAAVSGKAQFGFDYLLSRHAKRMTDILQKNKYDPKKVIALALGDLLPKDETVLRSEVEQFMREASLSRVQRTFSIDEGEDKKAEGPTAAPFVPASTSRDNLYSEINKTVYESAYRIAINMFANASSGRKYKRVAFAPFSANPTTVAHMYKTILQALAETGADRIEVSPTYNDYRKPWLRHSFIFRWQNTKGLIDHLNSAEGGPFVLLKQFEEEGEYKSPSTGLNPEIKTRSLNGEEKIMVRLKKLLSEGVNLRDFEFIYGIGGDHYQPFYIDNAGKLAFETITEANAEDHLYYLSKSESYNLLLDKIEAANDAFVDGIMALRRTQLDELKKLLIRGKITKADILGKSFPKLDTVAKVFIIQDYINKHDPDLKGKNIKLSLVVTPRLGEKPSPANDELIPPSRIYRNPGFTYNVSATDVRSGLQTLLFEERINPFQLSMLNKSSLQAILQDRTFLWYMYRIKESRLGMMIEAKVPRDATAWKTRMDNIRKRYMEKIRRIENRPHATLAIDMQTKETIMTLMDQEDEVAKMKFSVDHDENYYSVKALHVETKAGSEDVQTALRDLYKELNGIDITPSEDIRSKMSKVESILLPDYLNKLSREELTTSLAEMEDILRGIVDIGTSDPEKVPFKEWMESFIYLDRIMELQSQRKVYIPVAPVPTSDQQTSANAAMEAPGGIDLNAKNFTTTVTGETIDIQFNPDMVEQFKQGDFKGIAPVIINITPISSILPLLGMSPRREEQEELAAAGV